MGSTKIRCCCVREGVGVEDCKGIEAMTEVVCGDAVEITDDEVDAGDDVGIEGLTVGGDACFQDVEGGFW